MGQSPAEFDLMHFSLKIWHLVATNLMIFLRTKWPNFMQNFQILNLSDGSPIPRGLPPRLHLRGGWRVQPLCTKSRPPRKLIYNVLGGSILTLPPITPLTLSIMSKRTTDRDFSKISWEETPFMWGARVYKLLFVICLTEDVRSMAPSLQLHRYGDREK